MNCRGFDIIFTVSGEIILMRMTDVCNPMQTVLLSCRSCEKDNIITLDWHMPLSFSPMMYAVSIGKTRHSLGMIRESGCFAINFIPKSLEKEALFCGRNSGRDADKFAEIGLGKEECGEIGCARIKEAAAYLECRVKEEVEAGDHILFIAEVLKADMKSNGKRLFHLGGDMFTTTEG